MKLIVITKNILIVNELFYSNQIKVAEEQKEKYHEFIKK